MNERIQWGVSDNGAWVVRGDILLGPFSTRKTAGRLLAQRVAEMLNNAEYEATCKTCLARKEMS